MGWFDDDSQEAMHYQDFQNTPQHLHEAKFSHELIGGAAAFEAMKAYEDHEARNGQIENHARAKEVVAGLIGAFVDREVETKGLDFVDREKVKHHAQRRAERQMEQSGRW
ncbi:uncharacterized protein N7498_004032 [Penicillium cinerascens]|uniref:CipC-like antibiotic response protein n=1 Tax=Penicillium cinerascens TaxID=70096 RepID=A0A9W9N3B6_9EURO|nr:uncharacterized protein N7498_004032 [Penicillium cinerascens]KAJ5212386.1 hypothetical protein N7498_004032 [Penicillium cinerascens]